MVNTSVRPITVDGVRVDTLGWNVEEIRLTAPGSRSADTTLPGMDGVVASMNDPREPGMIGLSLIVFGADADGLVPTNRHDLLEANLSELVHLFSKRHGLIDYRRQVDVGGTMRQAWVKVTDALEPELTPGSLARFSVSMMIPSGSWEDVATADWASTGNPSGTTYGMTTFDGGTERINDAVILVTGPTASGVKVTDPTTGAYVQLGMALAAGDTWRVNVASWSSRTALAASPLTLGSADSTGTDRAALTSYGPGQVLFLPLTPRREVAATGKTRYDVKLEGSGFTTGTSIQVRAKRKFRL